MSMIHITFEQHLCGECGLKSPGAILQSFNTFAPPPSSFTYDGSCIHCGSENTEIVQRLNLEDQNDQT